jgi:thioredoxin 2
MSRPIVSCPACGQANRLPEPGRGGQAVCGRCRTPLRRAGAPVVLDGASFDARAAIEPVLVVDFWAAWCGPCRVIAPIVEKLAGSMENVTFAKVDVDANPELAARFRVEGIPTLVFMSRGVEKGRLVGAVGEAAIRQGIATHLGGAAG